MYWTNILGILIVCAYFENGFGFTIIRNPSVNLKPEPQKKTVPPGYFLFQNSYYKYFNHAEEWEPAQEICEKDGGHLVIINSKDEASLLMRLMKENPHEIGGSCLEGYIYVGLQKTRDEKGQWTSVDGQLLENSGYNQWAPGEPNSWNNIEYCGTFYREGGLNDFPCWCSKAFVCEIPAKEFIELPKLEKVENSLNSLHSSTESNKKSIFDFLEYSSSISDEDSPEKHENSAESSTKIQEKPDKIQEPENKSPLPKLHNYMDGRYFSLDEYSSDNLDATEINENSADNFDHSSNNSEYSSKNSAETEEETDKVQEPENNSLSLPKPENVVKSVDSQPLIMYSSENSDDSTENNEYSPDNLDHSSINSAETQEETDKVKEPENKLSFTKPENVVKSVDSLKYSSQNGEYSLENFDINARQITYSLKNIGDSADSIKDSLDIVDDILKKSKHSQESSTKAPEEMDKEQGPKYFDDSAEIIKDSLDIVDDILKKSNYSQDSSTEDPEVKGEEQGQKRKKYISILFSKIKSLWDLMN